MKFNTRTFLYVALGVLILAVFVIGGIIAYNVYANNNVDRVSDLIGNESSFGISINCEEDYYNCDDFESKDKAQEVYDACSSEGKEDIHNLDSDGDGIVCEGMN